MLLFASWPRSQKLLSSLHNVAGRNCSVLTDHNSQQERAERGTDGHAGAAGYFPFQRDSIENRHVWTERKKSETGSNDKAKLKKHHGKQIKLAD